MKHLYETRQFLLKINLILVMIFFVLFGNTAKTFHCKFGLS